MAELVAVDQAAVVDFPVEAGVPAAVVDSQAAVGPVAAEGDARFEIYSAERLSSCGNC